MSDRRLTRSLSDSFAVRRVGRFGARFVDEHTGGGGVLRDEMRHVFPDHWSFFLGEIALYCFIVLVATGTYMALFFHASSQPVTYAGSYVPLRGQTVSDAYRSVVDLSFDVRAGLLVRQVHHWAALVFAAAIALHLFRMLFTGAYRRPRRLNWVLGLSLLMLVFVNGVFGYSLPDDLLSGTGLRIAYSITESQPVIGPTLASLMFGGTFPSDSVIARIYPVHIFLFPALIAGLLSAHLGLLWLQRHTEFPGRGRDDRTIVGTALVPAYALRTTGFLLLLGAALTFMGGFFQINPVWLYGPYHAWDATSSAQPDWYTGWLEGAVRLTPSADLHIGPYVIPGLFWPAAILPGILAGFLFVWPWIDGLLRDDGFHNVLDGARTRPGRTALGMGLITFLTALLVAGGDDVFVVAWGGSIQVFVNVLRVLVIAAPVVVAVLTFLACRAQRDAQRLQGGRA